MAGRRARGTPAISGALVVGYYDDGKLQFAGKVGAGFTGAIRKELLAKMQPLVQDDPPFDTPPPKDYKGRWGGDLNAVTWIRPELVMRAELGGWTRDGVVRQAAYKGLELERDPTTVRRESAVATTSAVRAAEAEAPATPDTDDDDGMPREPSTEGIEDDQATDDGGEDDEDAAARRRPRRPGA